MKQSSHTLMSAIALVIFTFSVTTKLTTAEHVFPPAFVEVIINEGEF